MIETGAGLDGLAGLYRFNNDGVYDVITGKSGTLGSGGGYSIDAVFGSHGFKASSWEGIATLAETNVLHDAPEVTIAFWVKMRDVRSDVTTLPLATGFSMSTSTRKPSFAGLTMNHTWQTGIAYAQTSMEEEQWYFLAATYNSSDGWVRIYVNGVEEGTGTKYGPGPNFRDLGARTVGYNHNWRDWPISVDELMLFRRQLSPIELQSLYRNGLGVKVQLSSGSSTNTMSDFVGPEGTNSAYTIGGHALTFAHGFDPSAPYVQYKVAMANSAERTTTPLLDSMVFLGTGAEAFDDRVGDFGQGVFGGDMTTYPANKSGSYLGLAKRPNGGYLTDGSFISQPLDAGEVVTWSQLSWEYANTPIANTEAGLLGLWPMDGSWTEISGLNVPTTASPSVRYTDLAKVGGGSSVFNGDDAFVTIGAVGEVRSLEFWIDYDDPNGGVLEITSLDTNAANAILLLTNGWLRTEGWSSPVDIYVNGFGGSARLEGGWNHVALVLDSPQFVDSMVVGQVGTAPFAGKLDDMAAFSRTLGPGEIAVHYHDALPAAAGTMVLPT